MLIIMIRTVILYAVIILMMRLMGKKQLGERFIDFLFIHFDSSCRKPAVDD